MTTRPDFQTTETAAAVAPHKLRRQRRSSRLETVTVDPRVLSVARRLAKGNPARIELVDAETAMVWNQDRRLTSR